MATKTTTKRTLTEKRDKKSNKVETTAKTTEKAVKTSPKKTEYVCRKCGVELTEDNCRSQECLYCVECESKAFEELEKANGTSLGLYLACSRFDVPLYPLLITDKNGVLVEEFANAEDKWLAYLDILDRDEKLFINDRLATFTDGEARLLYIFGRKFDKETFADHVVFERERIEKQVGTNEQRERWGTRPLWQNLPMTNEIYNELDRMFFARLSRYKGVTVDEQLEDTIKKWTTLSLVQDHLRSLGDAAGYDKVQKSIDSMLAAEQLRKKDEKPIEGFKFDSAIKALEDAGLVEDGKFLSFDDTRKALLGLAKNIKYDYPLDMVDQMLFGISNNMRANAGVLMETELPDDLVFEDKNGEFLEKSTKDYEDKSRFIGSTNVRPITKGKKKK